MELESRFAQSSNHGAACADLATTKHGSMEEFVRFVEALPAVR